MSTASVLIIGDIHGSLDKLTELWSKLETIHTSKLAESTVVFLGDYIDRGPDSAGVVSFIRNLQRDNSNIIALKGNHEDMLVAAVDGDREMEKIFIYNGGVQTLESYDYTSRGLSLMDGISAIVGPYDMKWYRSLPEYYVINNIAIAHAGLNRQELTAEEHDSHGRLWSRGLRKTAHEIYKFTVHGHTPMDNVAINEHTAYIDTGAVFGGKLTCLYIPDTYNPNYREMELIQV